MAIITVVDDNFNRTNTSPSASPGSVGNNWNDVSGNNFSIQSNKLNKIAGGVNIVLRRPTSEKYQNQGITEYFQMSTTGYYTVGLRVLDANTSYYYSTISRADNTLYLGRTIGGSSTAISTKAITGLNNTTNYRLNFEVSGINPTTLTALLYNDDTNTLIDSLTTTDSNASLQTTGSYLITGFSTGVALDWDRAFAYYNDGTSISLSPTFAYINQSVSVTITGVGTNWLTSNPTFTVSGGTGASITSRTINSDTSATITLSVGSASGTLTITDPSSNNTASFLVLSESFAVTNSNLVFSPKNWHFNGSTFAQSNNPGAYIKVAFTGTTFAIDVDVSALVSQSLSAADYPVLETIIDDVSSISTQLTSTSSRVTIASGLATGNHTALIRFTRTNFNTNRWGASGNNAVRITGIACDTLTAVTPKTKSLLIYGDSITEGAYINAATVAGGDSSRSFSALLGEGLDAEYGVIGFSAQGWLAGGAGNVPTFPNAWNLQFSGQSRSFTAEPDYVVVVHGRNDSASTDGNVTTAVTNWINSFRSSCPSCYLFLVIPFAQTKASAITSGFNAATFHSRNYLIDLGAIASKGMSGSGSANAYTVDGTHPNPYGHARIGAALAKAIQERLNVRRPRKIRL